MGYIWDHILKNWNYKNLNTAYFIKQQYLTLDDDHIDRNM
jgi:hypothetical protein